MLVYRDLSTGLETEDHNLAVEWFNLHHEIALIKDGRWVMNWEW